MSNVRFNPELSIKLLNEYRVRFLNQSLTRVEVDAIFADCKLPSTIFNAFLKAENFITRVGYNEYKFIRRTPIYIGELKALHRLALKGPKEPTKEEQAIAYLKSLGYTVLKEV